MPGPDGQALPFHSTRITPATTLVQRRFDPMRRRLSDEEKAELRNEQLYAAREAFPEMDIEVIVEDFTLASGEPHVRVISKGRRVPAENKP